MDKKVYYITEQERYDIESFAKAYGIYGLDEFTRDILKRSITPNKTKKKKNYLLKTMSDRNDLHDKLIKKKIEGRYNPTIMNY